MLPNIMGIPAIFWSFVASYTCLLGGLCLILGLFTRIASIPLIIFMVVAVALVHWKHGFFITEGGWEYNFIVVAALVALLFLGTGNYGLMKNL